MGKNSTIGDKFQNVSPSLKASCEGRERCRLTTRNLSGWFVGATTLLSASILSAQASTISSNALQSPASAGLEEVIVTAERRAENQQEVPISITTLSADTLTNIGVMSTDALTAVTPGLLITRRSIGATPSIRGVGSQNTAPGAESSVATYVDGVYHMSPSGNILSFNNIEQVQILKGPQGTLFGRNASGGLINVVTRDPQADPSIEARVSYANYNTWEGSAYGTGGTETFATDIAVYAIRQNDGFGKNLNSGNDVNERAETGVRGKLLWTPSERDRFLLSADWATRESDLGATRNTVPGSLLIGGIPFNGDAFDSHANLETDMKDHEYWGMSLRYEHEFDWATFSSLTAYRDLHMLYLYDGDASPLPITDISIIEDTETLQQEFLLVGSSGSLDWTTGLFLFEAESRFNPLQIESGVAAAANFQLFSGQKTRSYAGFAQGTYAITEGTGLTAGLRYTEDTRDFSGIQIAAAGHPSPVGTIVNVGSGDATFPKVTWRLAIDQKLTPNILAYASYSRGFKSGEYNTVNLNQAPVRPETLDAVEAGLKTELFDRLLRLNVAGFHFDITDMQLYSVQAGSSTLLNAAQGDIKGLDVEVAFAPSMQKGDLEIRAGLSLLDAEYESFPLGILTAPAAGGGNTQVVTDLSGNTMVSAPKWTFNAAVDHSLPVGAGTLRLSANYFHNDGFFWDYGNRLEQSSYDVVNGQVSYSFGGDEKYRVRVFGSNLSDERYYIYVQEGTLGDLGSAAFPRMFGIGFDVRFP